MTKKRRFFKPYKPVTDVLLSPVDVRDGLYAVSTEVFETPRSAQLKNIPSVKNQGPVGSCGSHAFASAYESLYGENPALSERHHYYKVREMAGTLPSDNGQYLRDGAKIAAQGFAPEVLCPYDIAKINEKPSLLADSFARWFKIARYERCYSLDAVKVAIALNKPVVLGFRARASDLTATNGRIRDTTSAEIGGHAVLVVAYNDELGSVQILNSWGRVWGDAGFAWMSYELFNKRFMEAWAVSK